MIEETGSSQSKRERAVGSIPLLLLVVSVAMNVVLGHQLSLLRESASLRPFLNGSQAPDINLQGTDGENPHLAFGQGKTPVLFYWFSPSCSWCEANLANFKALSSQAQGKYRFVAVSSAPLTELKAYQERYGLNVPVYHVSSTVSKNYRFAGTPETLLVSGDGSLKRRWQGAYSPSVLTDLKRLWQ